MNSIQYILLLLLVAGISACGKEKSGGNCQGSGGGTYMGNAFLSTQAQVDSFGAFNYDAVVGRIEIIDSLGMVNDLEALCSIKKIQGSLGIWSTGVTSLQGLHNIDSIFGNDFFTGFSLRRTMVSNLDDLNHLKKIDGYLFLIENPMLTNLDGIEFADCQLNDLYLYFNPNLSDISGLSSTRINSSLVMLGNASISNLPVIDIAPSITLSLSSFPDFNSWQSLANIDSIGLFNIEDNDVQDLSVFSNLEYIGDLTIVNNSMLDDFCAIETLIPSAFTYQVSGNLYNPTMQDFLNGDCSP